MERSLDELDGPSPSLLLLGMRGAGKTTLGRLAAEHLKIPFIDADELFGQLHAPLVTKTYVAAHGWDSFRKAETNILKNLLEDVMQDGKSMVISLGGGVVEEECNRELLIDCWSKANSRGEFDSKKKIAVIHVFRELEKVLLDNRGLPSWGVVNGADVWERRRPWFRECSSHEFVNFTEAGYLQSIQDESSRAARLRFEAVERDFILFLVRLLKAYKRDENRFAPLKDERTYLATLPFEDLHPHVKQLQLITQGVDAVELRADLLRDPLAPVGNKIVEAYENPSLSYLSEQVALIRRHLPGYPLIFTLRTPAQGGRYPHPANAPAQALFKSLHHALKLGCEMIDIEMRLDAELTRKLIEDAKIRSTSILLSWRDKTPPQQGGFNWSSKEARALYDEAVSMGADIVKIVGTAGQISDNFALRIFAASVDEQDVEVKGFEVDTSIASLIKNRPPLSAYNMGYKGRISRFLNPVLASVTHDIAKQLTSRGIIGNPSMTFNEIQRALHLSGLLEKASYLHLNQNSQNAEDHSPMYNDAFTELGLPFSMKKETLDGRDLEDIVAKYKGSLDGDLRGILLAEKVDVPDGVEIDKNVVATGHCDTIIIDICGAMIGCNKLVEGLFNMMKNSISPSITLRKHRSAIVLSDSKDSMMAKSAIHSLTLLRLGTISLIESTSGLSSLQSAPSIIIDTSSISLPSQELLRTIMSHNEGGLCISLSSNRTIEKFLQSQCTNAPLWQLIDRKHILDQVHALRFWHFTGRRMPYIEEEDIIGH